LAEQGSSGSSELEVLGERSTTATELLWDLVFVFAVTQVTTLLRHNLTWVGLGRSLLVVALIWWAWSAFVWATNAQDPDAPAFRIVLLASTALIFVVGITVPEAFTTEATLFAVSYICVRILHLVLYTDASRRGHASFRAISGFAFTVLVGMALLLVGSFFTGALRTGLWVAAAAIDYAGPAWLTRERLRGLQHVVVSHFAERYGLFIIICLGESIVSIGLGASGRPLTAARLAVVTLALLTTIGLWWTYFGRAAEAAQASLAEQDDPVLAAADAYSYLHLLLVAGIIVFAAGAKSAVEDALTPLSTADRAALCGGIAIYLVGHAAFLWRLLGELKLPQLLAAALCLAPIAVGNGPPWLTLAWITAILGLFTVYQMASGGSTREPEQAAASR
jgi:low temperature requirement protein LtrA